MLTKYDACNYNDYTTIKGTDGCACEYVHNPSSGFLSISIYSLMYWLHLATLIYVFFLSPSCCRDTLVTCGFFQLIHQHLKVWGCQNLSHDPSEIILYWSCAFPHSSEKGNTNGCKKPRWLQCGFVSVVLNRTRIENQVVTRSDI